MGNAATCSLVDVAGTVTVSQTDGQALQFVQPVFAFQVRKLHPGNWLVHDPTLGQHSKMSMMAGNEELQPGEIYFLLPIPTHFRKQQVRSKRHSRSNNSDRKDHERLGLHEVIQGTDPRAQEVVASTQKRVQQQPPPPPPPVLSSFPQQRPSKRCSRQRFHEFDWRPSLVTIPEVF